jgi:hypothetical protein
LNHYTKNNQLVVYFFGFLIHYLSVKYLLNYSKVIVTAFSLYVSIYYFRLNATMFFWSLSLIFYFATFLKSKIVVWTVALSLMVLKHEFSKEMVAHSSQSLKLKFFIIFFLKVSFLGFGEYSGEFFIFGNALLFLILRLICVSCDKIDLDTDETNDNTVKFKDYLVYSYYPTFVSLSPFVPFKNFISSVKFIF